MLPPTYMRGKCVSRGGKKLNIWRKIKELVKQEKQIRSVEKYSCWKSDGKKWWCCDFVDSLENVFSVAFSYVSFRLALRDCEECENEWSLWNYFCVVWEDWDVRGGWKSWGLSIKNFIFFGILGNFCGTSEYFLCRSTQIGQHLHRNSSNLISKPPIENFFSLLVAPSIAGHICNFLSSYFHGFSSNFDNF